MDQHTDTDHRRGERGLPLLCAAQQVFAGFAASYPLTVDIVDVRSESGQMLMARHRAR